MSRDNGSAFFAGSSSSQPLKFGMSKGSVLGPFLFLWISPLTVPSARLMALNLLYMFWTLNFISQAQISFPSYKLRHPAFYLTSPLWMFDKQIKLNVSKMELLVATPQSLPAPSPDLLLQYTSADHLMHLHPTYQISQDSPLPLTSHIQSISKSFWTALSSFHCSFFLVASLGARRLC